MSIYSELVSLESMFYDVCDPETGEILPEDDAAYEALKKELLNIGFEKLCKVRANFLSDLEGLSDEQKRIAERKKEKERACERLERYMLELLKLSGKDKIEAGTFKISARPSFKTIIDDEDALPPHYKVQKIEYKPDLKSIKDDLKNGVVVVGCHLQECLNLNVR